MSKLLTHDLCHVDGLAGAAEPRQAGQGVALHLEGAGGGAAAGPHLPRPARGEGGARAAQRELLHTYV